MDESLPYRIAYSAGVEKCKKCRHKIASGNLQIAIMVQSNEDDHKYPLWYHRECFFEVRLPATEAAFDGFAQLRYAHQMIMKKDLGTDDIESEAMVELESRIRTQNDEYFKLFDYIEDQVPYVNQIKILTTNEQVVPPKGAQIVHLLADIIYFGATPKCEKCGKGQLIFINWTYKCTHEMEWSMCGNEVNEPARSLAKIPEMINLHQRFLEGKRGVRTRALHQFRMLDDQGNDIVYGPYKKPPLFNMELVLIGDNFSKPRSDVEKLIKKLGGKVGSKVHDRVTAIISNADEVRKMDHHMTYARMYGIEVVPENFLNDVQGDDVDAIGYLLSENISDWGGNPFDRVKDYDVASRLETEFYEEPKTMTYKWKGGDAVDPECGLVENVHVYSANINGKRVCYSVILGHVDIQRNKNSYYRMQLLKSNVEEMYWLFTSWGRIGTVIGSKKLQTFPTLQTALQNFNSIYNSKTFNSFGGHTSKKHPNKFYHLDVEMKLKGMSNQTRSTHDPSKLDAPVYDLMQMLFDVNKIENMMYGCDLDVKQMPLGKISIKQIKMAMSTLQNIERLIQQNGSIHELRAASNKFYTLIPHSFGINRPPIIDTIETLTAKQEMLESLLNMEVIYGFLGDENGDKAHPLDVCYRKLKTSIVPLAKDSDEFRLLCEIVSNFKPSRAKVLEIFKVERDGEADRFDWKLRNHEMLWHGSRNVNFANILSNGLKAAPAEAPALTARMFGNGIYFADVITKSAGYCHPDRVSGISLMLLSEVALGIPRVVTAYTKVDDIPNEENQSVKALGRFAPTEYRQIDGVNIAYRGASSPEYKLHYNEFIVFDPNQIKMKYLFKIKF